VRSDRKKEVMRTYLWLIAWFFFLVASPGVLIWAIRRWWGTSPRIEKPSWRSYFAIGAVVLVGSSGLLWVVSFF